MYPHSPLVSICQLGIVILVLFSYPLQLHPCRASLDKVVRGRSIESEQSDHDDGEDIPLLWFVVETALVLFTTFLVSLWVERLEVVLGYVPLLQVSQLISRNQFVLTFLLLPNYRFVGATGSTTISFILPSLFFLSLFGRSESRRDKLLSKLAVGLLVWGITVMIVSLSLNICWSISCFCSACKECVHSLTLIPYGE